VTPFRLRRATCVIVFWRGSELVFQNYRTRVSISADPLLIRLLDLFGDWLSEEQVSRRLGQYTKSSIRTAVRQLEKCTLLIREGTPEAHLDSQFRLAWSGWLPSAGFFHFATKDVRYCATGRELKKKLRLLVANSPQPQFFKTYENLPRLQLPTATRAQGEFLEVLMSRRTHRRFSVKTLSLSSLSNILHYTWGITGSIRSNILGDLPRKTSPSAGARHPIETYVLALRVEGVPPGLYHYATREHCLEQLSLGNFKKKAVRYCADQSWVQRAAALFVMTAAFPRVIWKYNSPRAYRTVLLDAGHVCQTFCLVSTWLGLAPFCTMALRDTLIEKDLGLDGISESALYIAGVGLQWSTDTVKARSRLSASL
jgi:SagB-type dehydrogenase family enzyme